VNELADPIPNVPGHELGPLLREDGHEWVIRTTFGAERALTRIAKMPLSAASERRLRAAVFDGAPLDDRWPWELRRILDGYRVRAALPGDWSLPRVLSVGLAEGGRPYVTRGWLDGLALGAAMAAVPALDHVLGQMLELMDALHDRCVVVQDLKPDNLVLDASSRVWLVDLESLRAAPLGVVPCTHFTPRFAAPEQIRGRTSALASDLYAFGKMVMSLCDGAPPERWADLVSRCLQEDPAARPTAEQALAWLRKGVSLGERPTDATIRVPEPLDLPEAQDLSQLSRLTRLSPQLGPPSRPPAVDVTLPPPPPGDLSTITPLLGTPVLGTPVLGTHGGAVVQTEPAEPAPLVAPRRGRLRQAMGMGMGAVSLLMVGAVIWAGASIDRSLRATRENGAASDRLVAEARAGLREHKIKAEKNHDRELARWWATARQAAVLDPDADALGVLALATVWGQRWQRLGTVWDAQRFEVADALTLQAVEAGRTPEGMLARGLLAAAACRHRPTDRDRWCAEATKQLDRAARNAPDWMVVEARWGSVTVTNARARRAIQRGELVDAATAATQSLRQCELARPVLPAAPVNGVELMEDCTWAAGVARDRDAWLRWSTSWVVARKGPPTDPALQQTLARMAAPECAKLELPAGHDGSWTAWCDERAQLTLHCASQGRSSVMVALSGDCPQDTVSMR
jgi:hypothetical protein